MDTSELNGIEISIHPLFNHEGHLECTVTDGSTERIARLENYQIKKGWNTFSFENLTVPSNTELIFTFKSNVDFFTVEHSNYNNYLGALYFNDKPKKACLKFKLF